MSAAAAATIRRAAAGRTIIRGPWADRTTGAVCALQAVLDAHGWQPSEPRFPTLCRVLGVDAYWLHRFMMGFDRSFQIMFVDDKGDVIGKDDVSALGKALAGELVVR